MDFRIYIALGLIATVLGAPLPLERTIKWDPPNPMSIVTRIYSARENPKIVDKFKDSSVTEDPLMTEEDMTAEEDLRAEGDHDCDNHGLGEMEEAMKKHTSHEEERMRGMLNMITSFDLPGLQGSINVFNASGHRHHHPTVIEMFRSPSIFAPAPQPMLSLADIIEMGVPRPRRLIHPVHPALEELLAEYRKMSEDPGDEMRETSDTPKQELSCETDMSKEDKKEMFMNRYLPAAYSHKRIIW